MYVCSPKKGRLPPKAKKERRGKQEICIVRRKRSCISYTFYCTFKKRSSPRRVGVNLGCHVGVAGNRVLGVLIPAAAISGLRSPGSLGPPLCRFHGPPSLFCPLSSDSAAAFSLPNRLARRELVVELVVSAALMGETNEEICCGRSGWRVSRRASGFCCCPLVSGRGPPGVDRGRLIFRGGTGKVGKCWGWGLGENPDPDVGVMGDGPDSPDCCQGRRGFRGGG